jgi:3-oxoacyl-[acyl-carrier-protein] synthase-3
MAKVKLQNVAVRGVVCAVPGEPIDVATLGTNFTPAEVERITKTVGLKQVHRVKPGQTAGDLSIAAAKKLLEELKWEPGSIGGVIMVTQTPDHFLPATACIAHQQLGLSDGALAFDVGMGCSGYVYGLLLGAQQVATGASKRFLLLAGDTVSQILSSQDQSTALLFGDAGSATALEFDPEAGPISFVLGTDGTGSSSLGLPAGAFRQRTTAEASVRTRDEAGNLRAPTELFMDGLAVFNFTLKRVPPLVNDVLALHEWKADGVDAFLLHQANGFMLDKLGKKLALPKERVPVNIDRFGNTSVASIPLLLADLLSERVRSAQPQKLVLAGFGVGLSWAGAALTLRQLGAAQVVRV